MSNRSQKYNFVSNQREFMVSKEMIENSILNNNVNTSRLLSHTDMNIQPRGSEYGKKYTGFSNELTIYCLLLIESTHKIRRC